MRNDLFHVAMALSVCFGLPFFLLFGGLGGVVMWLDVIHTYLHAERKEGK